MSACAYAVVLFEGEGCVGIAYKTWIESREDVSIIKNVLASVVHWTIDFFVYQYCNYFFVVLPATLLNSIL